MVKSQGPPVYSTTDVYIIDLQAILKKKMLNFFLYFSFSTWARSDSKGGFPLSLHQLIWFGQPATSMNQTFLEFFYSMDHLTQWITFPKFPSAGNELDLVFTSEYHCVFDLGSAKPLSCGHEEIMFAYSFTSSSRTTNLVTTLNWFHYDSFSQFV